MLIAGSIVAAALILSWGLSSDEPRYELAASGDTIVRMDTDSGELIACNNQGCRRIVAPARAKTFGPLTVEFNESNEAKALPTPARPERQ
jgi:hypothetical protein